MSLEQQKEAIEKDIEIYEAEYSATQDLKYLEKVKELKRRLASLLR